MTKDSSRPVRNCRRTMWRQGGGRGHGRLIFSKRVDLASLQSAMCEAATSSASPPPSARDQLPSPLSTRCFTSNLLPLRGVKELDDLVTRAYVAKDTIESREGRFVQSVGVPGERIGDHDHLECRWGAACANSYMVI